LPNVPHSTPFSAPRAAPGLTVAVILLFLLALSTKRGAIPRAKRLSSAGAFAAAILLSMSCAIWACAGCGGGSAAVTAPSQTQLVTPQGTSTILVTPAAMSAGGKPLQLQPIQLTPIVN
jgi:hypothetical protein